MVKDDKNKEITEIAFDSSKTMFIYLVVNHSEIKCNVLATKLVPEVNAYSAI